MKLVDWLRLLTPVARAEHLAQMPPWLRAQCVLALLHPHPEYSVDTVSSNTPNDGPITRQQPPMAPPTFDVDEIFRYHPPSPDRLPKYEAIREAARTFAHVLLEHTPRGADQSAAVRHLRECVMTANASIALGGKL